MSVVPLNREPGAGIGAIGSPAATDEAAITAGVRGRTRRRRILVWGARVATLVIVIGGWQLLTSAKIVDPFFWGQPGGILRQLGNRVRHGTAYGSIWLQIWITMKEAVLGFAFGVAGGVVAGVLLGQVRFLADVLSPYL